MRLGTLQSVDREFRGRATGGVKRRSEESVQDGRERDRAKRIMHLQYLGRHSRPTVSPVGKMFWRKLDED